MVRREETYTSSLSFIFALFSLSTMCLLSLYPPSFPPLVCGIYIFLIGVHTLPCNQHRAPRQGELKR